MWGAFRGRRVRVLQATERTPAIGAVQGARTDIQHNDDSPKYICWTSRKSEFIGTWFFVSTSENIGTTLAAHRWRLSRQDTYLVIWYFDNQSASFVESSSFVRTTSGKRFEKISKFLTRSAFHGGRLRLKVRSELNCTDSVTSLKVHMALDLLFALSHLLESSRYSCSQRYRKSHLRELENSIPSFSYHVLSSAERFSWATHSRRSTNPSSTIFLDWFNDFNPLVSSFTQEKVIGNTVAEIQRITQQVSTIQQMLSCEECLQPSWSTFPSMVAATK